MRFSGHPEIADAVAFAVQNIEVGEDITCAYTTVSGQPVLEAALKQYLKSHLPSHMVPAYLLHFDCFPVTGNAGKFDRNLIKQTSLSLGCQSGRRITIADTQLKHHGGGTGRSASLSESSGTTFIWSVTASCS